MAIKLMYITSCPQVAVIAEKNGVDRIFVDMEYIGKSLRQGGMDTVQSRHTFEDIINIRNAISKAELMVRCNPIHDATAEYCSSKEEVDKIIECGADIIMLPYFKTASEVRDFVAFVNGRARTLLLVETPEAVDVIDEILQLEGIEEVFIGLNDLSLGYKKKFMFELLSDGTVEGLCKKFKQRGIPYGFGGIASIGKGILPSEYVIREHYRLGSTCAILSRSFCNVNKLEDISQCEGVFQNGLTDIRDLEKECKNADEAYFERNRIDVRRIVGEIVELTKS